MIGISLDSACLPHVSNPDSNRRIQYGSQINPGVAGAKLCRCKLFSVDHDHMGALLELVRSILRGVVPETR